MRLTHFIRQLTRLHARVGVIVATTVIGVGSSAGAQQPAAADYIIGPSDVISVAVFNFEKYSCKCPVGADGTINVPDLGRIKAGGLTVQRVEEDVRDRFAKTILRNPQVTVSVEQYRSQQVIVTGFVRQPQPLEFKGSMSLFEVLAKAGSVTERAGVEVWILRSPEGKSPDAAALARAKSLATDKDTGTDVKDPNVIRIDLEALQKGDFTQNVALRGGDIVYVPPARTVIVQGHVGRVGEVQIKPGMTVQQVLALAGGITDRGSDRRIQIIRTVNGKKTTIDAKLEDVVQGDDIINVRQRFL